MLSKSSFSQNSTLLHIYILVPPPVFPNGTTGLLSGWPCNVEKEIWGPSESTGLWLWTNMNSKRPKLPWWPNNQSRGNPWNFSPGLSYRGYSVSPNQSEVLFPFLEHISGIDLLSDWQNPHIVGDIESILYSYLFFNLPFWVAELIYISLLRIVLWFLRVTAIYIYT